MAADKRLLVVETELVSAFKVAARHGNTLSPVIRSAWDNGYLSTLTRNSPLSATDAHISIIGHITREELLRHLDSTEAASGYANRFIWFAVRRSKTLPEGGNVATGALAALQDKLRASLAFGRAGGLLGGTGRFAQWTGTYTDRGFFELGAGGSVYYDQLFWSVNRSREGRSAAGVPNGNPRAVRSSSARSSTTG